MYIITVVLIVLIHLEDGVEALSTTIIEWKTKMNKESLLKLLQIRKSSMVLISASIILEDEEQQFIQVDR